jgi:small subunit ribosomal protein S20
MIIYPVLVRVRSELGELEARVAQHKAAEKSVRQDAKARLSNRSWKSKIKTARKRLETALERGETANLNELFKEYVSIVDRATAKGVLHMKTASRKKHNMARRLKAVGGAATKPPKGAAPKPDTKPEDTGEKKTEPQAQEAPE